MFTEETIETGHKFIIVHFHADGGQACVPGQRVFMNPEEAVMFANDRANELGHKCEDSVKISYFDGTVPPPNVGYVILPEGM